MSVIPMQTTLLPTEVQMTEEALNLCVRNKPSSPTYTYDYNSNRSSPHQYFEGITRLNLMSSPSTVSEISETSDRVHGQPSPPDPLRNCQYTTIPTQKTKTTRPFKAYPKTPLPLVFPLPNGDPILDHESAESYLKFRNQMLSQLHHSQNGTNKNMRRISVNTQNGHNDDPIYWEKRKKNNEAAKRSRDARRAKEDEIAIRCAFLEQENIRLRFKLATLEEQLKHALYR